MFERKKKQYSVDEKRFLCKIEIEKTENKIKTNKQNFEINKNKK